MVLRNDTKKLALEGRQGLPFTAHLCESWYKKLRFITNGGRARRTGKNRQDKQSEVSQNSNSKVPDNRGGYQEQARFCETGPGQRKTVSMSNKVSMSIEMYRSNKNGDLANASSW